MKLIRVLTGTLLMIAFGVAAGRSLSGRTQQASSGMSKMSSPASAASFPKDVYANTGNRLPAIKRDDMDDAGKKAYDSRPPADSFGPGAIRLYSPPVAEHMGEVNDFLRRKSGLDPRLVELAILVTARESDCEYVWTAHEPQGVKAGLSPETIDVVKYRKPTTGLAEKDAAIIDLGREVLAKHHVSSATFARAQSLFGNQGLVNFVALMGDYSATTILLNAFDQHIRPTDTPLLPIP
jgi:4-carboxymuconolactone decarboxylase